MTLPGIEVHCDRRWKSALRKDMIFDPVVSIVALSESI